MLWKLLTQSHITIVNTVPLVNKAEVTSITIINDGKLIPQRKLKLSPTV